MMLTIFTPTYNRAKLLNDIFNSLEKQSCFDFEWLIIDDGSNDNTENVVINFLHNSKFPVRYIKKENGGKHTAYNLALENARGELFFCLDSDDYLPNNAIEKIKKFFNNLNREIITSTCGFLAYKIDRENNLLSDKFPLKIDRVKLYELDARYGCRGEFSIILFTQIAKKYPFPVFDNEKFVGECVIYDQINILYDFILLKEVITICEYQSDGYTNMQIQLMKNNPSGYCMYFKQRLDLQNDLISKIIISGKYHAFKFLSKNKDPNLVYDGENKFLVKMTFLLGIVFYIYYRWI